MDIVNFRKSGNNIINYWWLILLAGVLLISLGIWVITSPLQSYLALSMIFAIGMLAAGLFEVTFSAINYRSLEGWGWALVGGIIDLLIGGYLITYPTITMVILPLIVGVWLLFRGIMAIGNAFEMHYYGFADWWWFLVTGIAIILLALMILVEPTVGVTNIIIWT
ncbi:MAG: HdeD family acid-resistance protein, partial [Mucilaginibacter sp.]